MPYLLFPTAFGTCGLAWNEAGLTGFQLAEESRALAERRFTSKMQTKLVEGEPPVGVQQVVVRVQQHFEGRLQDFSDVRIDWSRVSDFQKAVYLQAQTIKPGYTRSYGEIAKALSLGPEVAHDVGVALSMNPWPLLVPCHRVVSAGGKMTGFSAPGGVRTKTRLLVLEGAELLSE
jgi:methylated-DNA-[protein]-cysteine S-methyltransferase